METSPKSLLSWITPAAMLSTAALLTAACERDDLAPAPSPAASAVAQSAVTVGRVGYWKFDGNANDAVGTRNGTVVGGTYEAGVAGQALRLNGTAYADLPKGLLSSGSGSVSLWVKTTQANGILFYGANQAGGDGFGNQEELYLGLSNGRPQLFIEGSDDGSRDFQLTGNKSVNDGQWHQVAATWSNTNESSECLVYVDGEVALSSFDFEDGKNLSAAKAFPFSQLVRLGRPATATRGFQGLVDDVVVYNRVLDFDEVSVLFQTVGGKPLEYVVENYSDPRLGSPFFLTTLPLAGVPQTKDWTTSSALRGFSGTDYLHDGNVGADPDMFAAWYTPITEAGTYDVYMRWTAERDRPDAAPVQVKHRDGVANLTVNQRLNGGQWVKIGTWNFNAYDQSTFFFDASNSYVRISGADAGYTIADAVRFVKK